MFKKIIKFTKDIDKDTECPMGRSVSGLFNFIKYHNAFVIIIMFVFVVSFSALAANEDLRDKVLGEKIVIKSGIDNSVILAADLENFDLEMKILDVREDENNYYLAYQFKTLGIQENVWQITLRQKELEISKKVLAVQDLGLYVTEELGEVIDYELAYLKEVQENENKKGDDRIVRETKYEGLLGLIISTKTKELPPEYELVVKLSVAEEILPAPFDEGGDDDSTQENGANEEENGANEEEDGANGDDDWNSDEIDIPDDSSYYQKLKELCEENDLFWYDDICNDEPETVLVCDPDNLILCDTEDLCDGINLYWYNNVCNDKEEVVVFDPVCDSDNLNLCDQSNCETEGGFWYDDICNVEPETVLVCDPDNLILCDTKDLCDGINLYWHNGTCNDKEEVVVSDPVCDSDNLNLCGQSNCETEGGFWYDDVCNVEPTLEEAEFPIENSASDDVSEEEPADDEPAGEEVAEE